jgi:hypothetical protein
VTWRNISLVASVVISTAIWMAPQSPGYVTTGEVVGENEQFLQLDKHPCQKIQDKTTFVKPVKRKVLDEKQTCPKGSGRAGRQYVEEQVEQLAPPSPTPTPTPSPSAPKHNVSSKSPR